MVFIKENVYFKMKLSFDRTLLNSSFKRDAYTRKRVSQNGKKVLIGDFESSSFKHGTYK